MKCQVWFGAFIIGFGIAVISLIEPLLKIPCQSEPAARRNFDNPAYLDDICLQTRFSQLLYLTKEECDFGRRIMASIILGGAIGLERRRTDRPAGIRTMSLVSLGSCLFTITSMNAFIHGPMEWDSSRVAAAIPSGVGFLGVGIIWKQDQRTEDGSKVQNIHGLTTAASIWLSAAVGITCGGGMYVISTFTVSIMVLLLRFGPHVYSDREDEFDDIEENGPGQVLIKYSPATFKRGVSGFYGSAAVV